MEIMLRNTVFADNEDMIIEESLSMFLAGSITVAAATSNLICYLLMNPNVEDKLRKSLSKIFNAFNDQKGTIKDLVDEMTMEKLEFVEDDYLKYCFNETMRIEPSLPINSTYCFSEDVVVDGIKIKAG